MGFKRPLDTEEIQGFNVKHARQLKYGDMLTQLAAIVPYKASLEKPNIIREDMNDDPWNKGAHDFQTSLYEEDIYSCPIDRSIRKQVPIGLNHQADIPEFVKEDILKGSDSDREREKLMGKCIIPLPEIDVCESRGGRTDCICWDMGSIRCVRQHIMEARQDLTDSIGYEKFMKLGLCEMGEEVSHRWTEEEEHLFHEVVYSNSVSLHRNFWKQLKTVFITRKMKELVSYYFNVFILQRRAVQNRDENLDIDSDDDEWQVDYDKSSSLEYPFHQYTAFDDDDDDKEDHLQGNYNVYIDDMVSQLYTFDTCDMRLQNTWNKNVDLLPTSNMIEEIFGEERWEEDDEQGKGRQL